jgi:pilus assembly protein TadC
MIIVLVIMTASFVLWRRRRRSTNTRTRGIEKARAYEDLIDVLLVALNTGISLPEAIAVSAQCLSGEIAREVQLVVNRLEKGESLFDVLPSFGTIFGTRAYPLVDILHNSLADGMPVMHVVERLSDEVRAERHRRMDEELRRLPIRLVFPLALCVLPSFVLLTIVPLGIRALSTITQGTTP